MGNIVIEELEDILLCDTKIITLAINRSDGILDLRDTLEDFRNHLFNYLESKNIKEIRKKNALYCSGKTKLGLSQITRTNFGLFYQSSNKNCWYTDFDREPQKLHFIGHYNHDCNCSTWFIYF